MEDREIRNFLLNDSMYPLAHGLPGSMNNVWTGRVSSQSRMNVRGECVQRVRSIERQPGCFGSCPPDNGPEFTAELSRQAARQREGPRQA